MWNVVLQIEVSGIDSETTTHMSRITLRDEPNQQTIESLETRPNSPCSKDAVHTTTTVVNVFYIKD